MKTSGGRPAAGRRGKVARVSDPTPPPLPRPVVPFAQAVPTPPPPSPPLAVLPMAPVPAIPFAAQAPGMAGEAILDYASPRKHAGRTRLPSRSKLEFQPAADGRSFTVVESLAAKGSAIFGLCFATVVLAVWGIQAGMYLSDGDPVGFVFVIGWLGYAALMLAVINNSWRRTILAAGRGADAAPAGGAGAADGDGGAWMSLTFAAPLHRKSYRWRGDQVYDIRVVPTTLLTTPPGPNPPLAEFQMQTATAPLVRLFTDHAEREIGWVYENLRRAMGREGMTR